MKIAIAASGSRGDVQPYVALGAGLHAAGHHVQVLTSTDFQELVEGAGLEFCAVGDSIEALLQTDQWRKALEKGRFLYIWRRMRAEVKKQAHLFARSTPEYVSDADLLIAGMNLNAFSVAERFNIPFMQAYLFPFTPTRSLASPLTPRIPKVFNRLSFHLMRQILWQSMRVADVTTRRELGLPAGSFWGPFRRLREQQVPALYGYSRHVLPVPSDWAAQHHVTGYWVLDPPAEWVAPPELVSFLQAGAPPIYVGFGSMGNRNPEATTQLVLKALELSGQRGILASGWGGLTQTDLPSNVFMLSSVPHSWLFPQVAAAVHHGGVGTTAASLRAGVPTIVVPFFADQPFWGQRVAELGVGPAPLPRRHLSAEKLAAAIDQAVTNAPMRQRAAELGELIRAENGVEQAVQLIEQLSTHSSPQAVV